MSKRVEVKVPKTGVYSLIGIGLRDTLHVLRHRLGIRCNRYDTTTSDGYLVVGVRIRPNDIDAVNYWFRGSVRKCEWHGTPYVPVYRWRDGDQYR